MMNPPSSAMMISQPFGEPKVLWPLPKHKGAGIMVSNFKNGYLSLTQEYDVAKQTDPNI